MLGIMGTLGISFNAANVVVLPLVLGIGVDAGVGLDLNLTNFVSIGARYLHTFYNEKPNNLPSGQSREESRFIGSVQLSIYF